MKETAKRLLKSVGLFPAARLAYRRINPRIAKLRRREIQFYRELLSPGALCFDIGANLGQKSDIFIAAGFRSIVVEPNENCQDSLRLQFKNQPRAKIIRKAVGRRSGRMNLYADGSDAAASLLPSWHRRVYGTDCRAEPQLVPVTTLDELIAAHGRPDYIKIDVEGFENEVLSGLSRPVSLLSFEFHANEIELAEACMATLCRFGKLSLRASDMSGNWLCPNIGIDEMLSFVKASQSKGDMYVWTNP